MYNKILPILFPSAPAHYTFILKQSRPLTFYSASQSQEEMPADLTWPVIKRFLKPNCNLEYAPPCQTSSSIILLIGSLLTFSVTYSLLNVSRNLENLTKVMDVSLPLTINALATTLHLFHTTFCA